MGDNMLVKFTVSNYKNFLNPITLDFTATHDYQFGKKGIKDDLLSKVIIYGENASGKSNLCFALFDIVALLTDKNTNLMQRDSHSFLNADGNGKSARFEYELKKDQTAIRYIYEKTMPDEIYYEELHIGGEKIYSYHFGTGERDFCALDRIGAGDLNFEYYEENLPVLRYIANNTRQPEDSAVRFIINYVSHMLWFRSLQDNGYIGLTTGKDTLQSWIIENGLVKEFQAFLQDIANIRLDLYAAPASDPTSSKQLLEKHARGPLLFERVKSSGTRALELFFYWSRKFKDVSFLCMDEFDAFYHFELARNVLRYIIDLDNVQAILTTHNSYLAGNDLLRPDCYFILQDGKLSSFADSTPRELREGHNLEKLLRNGEFHA